MQFCTGSQYCLMNTIAFCSFSCFQTISFKRYKTAKFNSIYKEYSKEYETEGYNKIDEQGRRFKASGRYWAYSLNNMIEFEKEGRIYYSNAGKPYLKHYLSEMPGNSVDNLWSDMD